MSRASDVYAAAVIAYQLLTGELPFTSTTDQHQRGSAPCPRGRCRRRDRPRQLIDLLRRMCAHTREDRPSAAQALETLTGAWRLHSPSDPIDVPTTGTWPEGLPAHPEVHGAARKIGSGTFGTVSTRRTTTWQALTGR